MNIPENWKKLLTTIPGYDPIKTAGDCSFEIEDAQTAIGFFSDLVTHVKGELAGRPFVLEDWQKAIVANLWGWKRPDGTRRYRYAFIYIPRKNGKTAFTAGLGLLVLFTDDEPGAELYCAAGEREQASLLFGQCEGMIHNEPEFESRVKIYKTFKSIEYKEKANVFKAISADAGTKHGFNTHFAVVDELHVQPNRELVDVLETSTGARRQPLIVYITTSDYDRPSICNEKYDYATKVRDGIIEDGAFLPVIYEASINDDWTDEKIWEKANPNIDVSISREYLAAQCKKAQEVPSYENTFKRLHLNIRTEQDKRWIQMDKWNKCGEPFDDSVLRGLPCYAGLDLASKSDITAMVLSFSVDDEFYLLPKFWIPEDRARERDRRDRIPYLQWEREGHVIFTPGNVVDYQYIRKEINDLAKLYKIQEIAFDPWNASQIATELGEQDGYQMVEFRQGMLSMNEPSKEFERLIMGGRLRHGGNPVLSWMASSVSIKEDPSGNIKPVKPDSKTANKIDGIVASIMAVGRSIFGTETKASVYESRGILTL